MNLLKRKSKSNHADIVECLRVARAEIENGNTGAGLAMIRRVEVMLQSGGCDGHSPVEPFDLALDWNERQLREIHRRCAS